MTQSVKKQNNKPEMTFSHLKREHVKYDMYEAIWMNIC